MKKAKLARFACAAGLVAACVTGLSACTAEEEEEATGYTGGVAATVNGVEIAEDDITKEIELIRSSYSVDTEETWAEWLITYGYTAEEVREQIIETYIQYELIRQGAAEAGVTVEESEIDSYVDTMKAYYDSDEDWEQALSDAGTTEEEYRENLELQLLYNGLYETFASDEEPAEEDVISYANTYISYYDGAKRSSHILFSADDEETAQSVLDQINSGELDFVDAVQEYSTDTSSAEEDGDVGWDALTSFVDEYQDALDELEVGQVSGLVTSDYGIHIIMCTDVFTAPEEVTSLDQLPDEFVEEFEEYALESDQSEAYSAWYEEYEEAADIVINDMPEGLSYDVDLSLYEETDDTDETTEPEVTDTVTNDDGSTTTTYSDGSTVTTDADGNVISETEATTTTTDEESTDDSADAESSDGDDTADQDTSTEETAEQ